MLIVRTDSGTTDWFSVSKGVRQGCIMSPQLFSVYTESIMREVEEEQNNSEYDELSVGGTKITELRYADDTALFSTTPEGLNNLVQAVNKHNSAYKLSINAAKTKIMELDKWQENTNIVIDNINVERVQSFQYLGAMFTTNGDGASNLKQRLAMAVQALNNMQYLWKSASKELKLKVLRTCIFPIGTYGCETWVLRKLDIKRINAFEMKCYRKVLRIPWIAHRHRRTGQHPFGGADRVLPEWIQWGGGGGVVAEIFRDPNSVGEGGSSRNLLPLTAVTYPKLFFFPVSCSNRPSIRVI